MVFRWFLPKNGGGQVRRYLRFRKTVLNRILQQNDRYPCPPITLFDFAHPDDAIDAERVQVRDRDAWRLSDDRVIGGFSESVAKLIRSDEQYQRYVSGGEEIEEVVDVDLTAESETDGDREISSPDEANHQNTTNFTPFLRWTGNLDTTIGLRSTAQRSGFAALRSPVFPMDGANLQGLYNALEIVCRCDGRLYTVNLKVASSIPDDLYQGHIRASSVVLDARGHISGDFETLVLPFGDFRLTSMGREREVYRELDDNICIESIGVALMDGKDGHFQFDLARIRAVNLYEGYVFEREPNKAEK